MRIRKRSRQARRGLDLQSLEDRQLLTGFVAYNGLYATGAASPNLSVYSTLPGQDSAGPLRDVQTGELLPVTLSVNQLGTSFGGNGSQPASGTDAANVFLNYVDFSAGDSRSIELDGTDTYSFTFDNLDRGATYQFAGTAIRGNTGYTDRWTLVELVGADSFRAAHSAGVGVWTTGLPANQVAVWTGANQDVGQGFLAQWKDIVAGSDNQFTVISRQYTGTIPTQVNPGGQAIGNKGYGLVGIRLIEDAPLGPPVVANTAASAIEAFAAHVGGRVNSTGGQIPDVRIYYGTTNGGTNAAAWSNSVSLGKQSRDFEATLTSLSQNTTYFYRAFAENGLGGVWASESLSFRTLQASVATVENRPVINVGAFGATVQGQVTNTGNDPPAVTIYYGNEDSGANPSAWDAKMELGVQTGAFSLPIAGLSPLTNYYARIQATNAIGSVWAGSSVTWRTSEVPPLRLSEVMTDNAGSLFTRTRVRPGDAFVGDRLTPDWVELQNPTSSAINLTGYFLTDDLSDPQRWQFPDGITLPAGGFLVVFASGLDLRDSRLDENGYLHTNFQLNNAGGEPLALLDAQGRMVSQFRPLPVQSQNISYGVDASGLERYFPVPTPGRDNANDTPASPRISVPDSTFTDSVTVQISAAQPTDVIYYTLDERVPTASSTRYTGPLTINASTQVRAIAIGANGKPSTVVSSTLIKLNSSVLTRSSNLPIVVIDSLNDVIGTSFTDVFIGVIEPGSDGRASMTNVFTTATRGGMHVRGSSSAGFAKKQYRVEFWDEANQDRRLPLLGMPNESDWIFYGPGEFDRNLISNPLMYDLSNQMGRYAVRTKWVEMYLNTGGGDVTVSDYVGVYAIMEVIEAGDERLDVGDLSTGAGGVPVSGGFVWKNDRGSPYVDPETLTAAQQAYIDGWINNLRNASAAANFKDPVNGYAKYAEVSSFIDHNLLNMFAMNVDALRLSSYYFKRPDGKLEAGPIWDFDRALDSTDGRDNNARTWYGTGDSTRYFNDDARVREWWPNMFKDPDFVQLYIDRWAELRGSVLSLSNINATIDRHAAELQEAAPRDYARWSGSRYGTFAGEINHLKAWIKDRVEWVDSQWLRTPITDNKSLAVPPGTQVNLTAPAGQIYYTLNGIDPRGDDGAIRPEAIRAVGPITINGATKLVARAYQANFGPTTQGYVPIGDDWSAPLKTDYFTEPPASAANLAITEVHYRPGAPSASEIAAGWRSADDFEFIELTNLTNQPVQLFGARLIETDIDGQSEGVRFDFREANPTLLAPGQRAVVVENRAAFEARYGTGATILGQWSGSLSNSGETISLVDYQNNLIRQFRYSDGGFWPRRADGVGSSLELIDPARDNSDPENWKASVEMHGSPGRASMDAPQVVINELVSRSDAPLTDSIELWNRGPTSVLIGGWYLSDSSGKLTKYRIPENTQLAAGAYRVFDESNFNPTQPVPGIDGFSLNSAEGDEVYLVTVDASGNPLWFVDSVSFPASAAGESFGRIPNGTGNLTPLTTPTLGQANSGPRVGPIVISEIQYAPAAPTPAALAIDPQLTRDDLEFIEIANPTGSAIELQEWRLRGGVDFDFPAGRLQPGDIRVLVSFDPTSSTQSSRVEAFRRHYQIDNRVTLLGPYVGKLSDQRERLTLQRPDAPPPDDPAVIPRLVEDEVVYRSIAPWPTQAGGLGSSLQRHFAAQWGSDPASWSAAAPTPGSANFTPPELRGDFNDDNQIDGADLDRLCQAIRTSSTDRIFDLSGDDKITQDDLTIMVRDIMDTGYGDANLDGIFNSGDLIEIFQAGEYQDTIIGNSVWATGDWNCDGEFDSSDLVLAFQESLYSPD